ncbi:uncharacterized protein [Blastocystis hominis]|uniref:Uncharacterized protein n=1 Tax=Blastocystis hominis TaxID=12968 RepID=D8M3V7_BLAHO|nr:uncharacterized protein [Blastocystis hominis]CBK22580.2 unnamed protein product [Blastocystis hominis]|eukprot:XP_012896628.1 uncharacterized protein [Blastocystis hominis]
MIKKSFESAAAVKRIFALCASLRIALIMKLMFASCVIQLCTQISLFLAANVNIFALHYLV